jgi:hypothetical protein
MPVNMYPKNEELDGIGTEALIDLLADCTARYTRLLLTDPNGEEYTATKDLIQRVQAALNGRIPVDGAIDDRESDRA